MKDENEGFDTLGVGRLRNVSLSQVQDAIAAAIAGLIDEKVGVTIDSLEFNGVVPLSAKVALRVHADYSRFAGLRGHPEGR